MVLRQTEMVNCNWRPKEVQRHFPREKAHGEWAELTRNRYEPLGCCFANYSIEERLIYFNIIELKDRGEQVGPDGNEEEPLVGEW